MTDLPEVRKYEEWRAINGNAETLSYALIVPRHLADAAIAALKAECKRRERCGNCNGLDDLIGEPGHSCVASSPTEFLYVEPHDHCHYLESEWELFDE
jgi:hypothetical protein